MYICGQIIKPPEEFREVLGIYERAGF